MDKVVCKKTTPLSFEKSHVLKGADSETLRTLLSSEKEERVSLSRTLSNSWLLA